jgi:predicted ribosome quality control (RQC) complex YloA/Tae2 family protein
MFTAEAEEKQDLTIERLHRVIQEQNDRLRLVEQENRRFQERLQVCFEELSNMQQTRRSVSISVRYNHMTSLSPI